MNARVARSEHQTNVARALTHASCTQLVRRVSETERIEARGNLDRRTRQLAFVHLMATVDGRIMARAQYTKSIVRIRPA
jgi:hypothetical protein